MSRTPFHGLTDAQLDALRRLLAAALAASPELADDNALQLVALADADAARRASRLSSGRVPQALSEPPLAPGELLARLSGAVESVRPQATSTTKWNGVASPLALALGLPATAVYVTSVGGLSRNISVRLAQSRRPREATVVAVMWAPGAEPAQQAIGAASRACVEIPRLTLVFTSAQGSTELAAIVLPPSLPPPAVLVLAYPRAALHLLTYDRRDDVLEVAAARGGPHLPSVLRHLIDHTTRIEVDSVSSLAPTRIVVDARDGVRTVIRIWHEGEFAG